MVLRGRGPWLASALLHGAVVVVVLLVFQEGPPPPATLRMRLVSSGPAAAPAGPTASASWTAPQAQGTAVSEPALPGWQGVPLATSAGPRGVPAPASLGELLGAVADTSSEPPPSSKETASGWSGAGGVGYSPPPLPPPSLAPAQGAQWDLSLSIPGGGGFATSLEGLDSGHPELDHWLEEYLRTVSFPSSPDGHDYRVRWTLRLETGRPE